jgi:hypothetical protein
MGWMFTETISAVVTPQSLMIVVASHFPSGDFLILYTSSLHGLHPKKMLKAPSMKPDRMTASKFQNLSDAIVSIFLRREYVLSTTRQ